ncbi:unnamed protein product, partial [marine sediment metagenome]
LKENYKIKTLNDGKASIVFYESDILRLEENTEIDLQEISEEKISIKQNLGDTWSRILRLTGKEYEIETPTTVATVRGTGFSVSIKEESVVVGDGTVSVKSKAEDISKDIEANKKAKIVAGKLQKLELDSSDIEKIEEHKIEDIKKFMDVRQKIIDRNKAAMIIIKKKQGWTDEDINNYLKDIDKGEIDVEEIVKQSPVKFNDLEKIAKITKEIQTQRKSIKDQDKLEEVLEERIEREKISENIEKNSNSPVSSEIT